MCNLHGGAINDGGPVLVARLGRRHKLEGVLGYAADKGKRRWSSSSVGVTARWRKRQDATMSFNGRRSMVVAGD
jgi:hypothetical protein